jgi:tRNA-Thr(GGU) m(6)t(6)A37 methyltransferase TsaA
VRDHDERARGDMTDRSPQQVIFEPIGHVEGCFDDQAMPEQIAATESRIVLDPRYVQGLAGIEAGDRVMVIFHFDRVTDYELMQHPRGDTSRPRTGVFAIHTPFRPNPIGVTVVELVAKEGNALRVRGLDALDGTPVLDLKRMRAD